MKIGDKITVGQSEGVVAGFRDESKGPEVQIKVGNLVYWFREKDVNPEPVKVKAKKKEESLDEKENPFLGDKITWT